MTSEIVVAAPVPSELEPSPGHLSKGQFIRFLDVVLIGPLMMYGGYKARMNPVLRGSLIAFGAGTVLYNGANFLAIDRERRRRLAQGS